MNSFLTALTEVTVVISVAIFVASLARPALRRWGGARLSYAVWSLVPLAALTYLAAMVLPTAHLSKALSVSVRMPSISFASVASETPTTWGAEHLWFAVYVLGFMSFAIWLYVKQRRFTRHVGSLAIAPFTHKGTPVCFASSATHGPFVRGLIRPTIVLPSDFATRYDETEQRLVLAHERAHVRGGVLYINFFAALMQVAFWFNPFVHWAVTRMRLDQELACDDVVLRKKPVDGRRIAAYANAVLKSAHPHISSPLVCHWQARHPLNERILSMNAPVPSTMLRSVARLSFGALFVVNGVAVVAFAEKPRTLLSGQHRIDVVYTSVYFDGRSETVKRRSEFSLVEYDGKLVSFKPSNESDCEFTFLVNPLKEDRIRIQAPFSCDGVQSRPTIVTKLRTPSSIEMSESPPDAPGNRHKLMMTVSR